MGLLEKFISEKNKLYIIYIIVYIIVGIILIYFIINQTIAFKLGIKYCLNNCVCLYCREMINSTLLGI